MVKKKIPEHEVVTFRCPKDLAANLKQIAISTIRQTGEMYTLSDLIRDTLVSVFPPPKQLKFSDKVEKKK
jgi:hypothetical protein